MTGEATGHSRGSLAGVRALCVVCRGKNERAKLYRDEPAPAIPSPTKDDAHNVGSHKLHAVDSHSQANRHTHGKRRRRKPRGPCRPPWDAECKQP